MTDETEFGYPIDVVGAFAAGDQTVINWGGNNYYKACDAPVVQNEDGSGTYCVKREEHPGDIHEDYDGIRKTDPKGRMSIVVTFPQKEDMSEGHKRTQAILRDMKQFFADQPDILVYGAIRESADQIIMILEGDG